MRMDSEGWVKVGSWAGLSIPEHFVFKSRELTHTDRAAGMKLACADTDFGAEPEFAAIGKLG